MRARLFQHDSGLVAPVTAATQRHDQRTHLFLEVEADGVSGYGEISPQPVAINGDPGLRDVVDELTHFSLRQLSEVVHREGGVPPWARVTHFAGSRAASRPASALLEMALLDRELRTQRRTIEDQWPRRFATPTQVTVSLLDQGPWADTLGAAQVRAKVSPAEVPTSQWRRLGELGLPVLLDFNCSASSIDDVVAHVARAVALFDVVAVEQPFAPGNVVEHARLATRVPCRVSLDEGVRHRRDLDQIVRYGAAQLVCIKPARVGGYAQARTMIERAQELGLEVYVGGFFESALARRANRVLARHYVSWPSDVADPTLLSDDHLERDEWGFGWRLGDDLVSRAPLVSHHG